MLKSTGLKISTSPVSTWTFPVALDARSRDPIFLQIARAVAEDVRRGRLKPGARLPGTRDLARTLHVHRNTVVAAYDELAAEGWIETAEAAGTFVSRSMPEVSPVRFTPDAPPPGIPPRAGFALGNDRMPSMHTLPGPRVLRMSGGIPDVRLVPTTALGRAYRRAVTRHATDVLSYAEPQGHARLRAAIAEMLAATRGVPAGVDDVLITRGSQMALDLAARSLVEPGDVVAFEALGYHPAWEAFRAHGAKLVSVPVDREGLDVAALAAMTRRGRIRAVYVTPHHQYPTMVTMSAARRLALLDLARRERIAVIEDDYDHEFHYEGRPVLPLASADTSGVVLYIGTLAKILAPGPRLGYVVAPANVLERMTAHRYNLDRQGDRAVEHAVAELFEDGEIQRHVSRARRLYHARRDAVADAFRRKLGDVLSFDVPSGGLAFWTCVAPNVDPDAWSGRALERGVIFMPGSVLDFAGKKIPFARFGYAPLDEKEIGEAVRRLTLALRDLD
jgi:GntR family transcriptional regulator/MocR family aminotransferase